MRAKWRRLRWAMESHFEGAHWTDAEVRHSNLRYHDEFESGIYADRWRQRFDRIHASGLLMFYERFLGRRIPRKGRILDVGCGVGRVSVNLAVSGVGGKIHGVDLSGGMLDRCRANALERRVSVHLTRGDVEAMPYPDQAFDAVFGTSILHHVPRPEKVLRESYRVLKPDGIVLFEEPNRTGTINALLSSWFLRKALLAPLVALERVRGRLFPGRTGKGKILAIMEQEERLIRELGVAPDVHVFTAEQLSRTASAEGFREPRTAVHSLLSGIFLLTFAPFIGVIRNRVFLKTYDTVLFLLWLVDRVLVRLLPADWFIMLMFTAVKKAEDRLEAKPLAPAAPDSPAAPGASLCGLGAPAGPSGPCCPAPGAAPPQDHGRPPQGLRGGAHS